METYENKKSMLQMVGSSFVIMTGLFVILASANNITGKVIGANSPSVDIIELIVVFWGLLITMAGIWMLRKKDFSESIFD